MENEYMETLKERNSIAKSAKVESTSVGMRVSSVPTKAEYESKCGDVVTYNYNRPMTLDEFKRFDDKHRKEYLEFLISRYDASQSKIRQMFGCSRGFACKEFERLGVKTHRSFGSGMHNNAPNPAWEAFLKKEIGKEEEVKMKADTNPVATLVSNDTPFKVTINSGTVSAEGDVSKVFPKMVKYICDNAPADCRISITWEKL